jgi:hypothetical protein
MENVGKEQVIKGWEGAETEEGGSGLGVSNTGGQTEGGGMEVLSRSEEEGTAVSRGAKWLTEVAEAHFLFGGGAIEEGEGMGEMVMLGRGEDGGSVVISGEGKNLGFGKVQMDAEGRAEEDELLEKKGEVFVWEEGTSVADERSGSGAGTKAIVAKMKGGAACSSTLVEELVEGTEELEEDKAGEGARKGVALGEAFFLGEIIKGAIRAGEVEVVGSGVHEVKVREERMEDGFLFDGVTGGIAGELVEHVDNVK